MEINSSSNVLMSSYGIPKFGGTDFIAWKIQILQLLREKKISDVIENEVTVDGKINADLRDNDEKAKGIIIRCLSNNLVIEFGEEQTAYAMWTKILNKYQKTTPGTKAYLIMKLCSAKYEETVSVEDFCRDFDMNLRALKAAGGEIDELVSVIMLLSKIPKSFENVKQALLTMSENDLTMERVRNRLMEVELEQKSVKQISVDSNQNLNVAFQVKKEIICYYCRKKGHKANQCKRRKKNRSDANTGTNANVVESMDRNFAMMSDISEIDVNRDICFVIDSAATDHLTNDESLFSNIKKLNNCIPIGTAKAGDCIEAKKGGTIDVFTLVSGREKLCHFKDVLYVPSLRHNLLSVSRIRKSGGDVSFCKDGSARIIIDNQVVGNAFEKNGLYWLKCRKLQREVNLSSSQCDVNELWHKRLGHLSMPNVKSC